MKNSLLPLFGMAFVAAGANAQSWTAPVPALLDGPVSGDTVLIYNVDARMFMTGANAWGTQVSISSTHASPYVLNDSTTADAPALTGWTLAYADSCTYNGGTTDTSKLGKYTFRDSESDGYVDMGSQGNNFWSIELQDNGYYRIRSNEGNTTYGKSVNENYDYQFVGYDASSSDPVSPAVVTMNTDPTLETSMIDWAFVDPDAFDAWNAKNTLYSALVDAADYDIDVTSYGAIYENSASTVDELTAAAEELSSKVAEAKAYVVLDGATEDNPKDGTSLLTNSDFSTGDVSGWTCTFVSGTNANNVGYQSASYDNGDVVISGFIEAWTYSVYSSATTYAALGEGELSQTLTSLPAGKYVLGADVIATSQYDSSVTNVSGVELFAIGGDIDNSEAVYTGNGAPEHFDLTFYSTGGDVTMGLRTTSACNANWIAADNFTLTYYGEVEEDPYKLVLDAAIESYEDTYDDLDGLKANQEVIDSYSEALAAAKAATDDYQTYNEALTAAANALATSVSEYETAASAIEDIANTIDTAEENDWGELVDDLGDLRDEVEGKYEDKTLTSDEIAEITDRKSELVATYISENAVAGEDVTILLTNPGFDSDFSGWTLADDSATPTWNADSWSGQVLTNDVEGRVQPSDLGSGVAEVYQSVFDISQTIKNMPMGLYTLSCQAFSRDDGADGIQAELYAVVNGEEQTQTVKSLYEDGYEEALFTTSVEGYEWQSDVLYESTGLYVPNSMAGANVWFYYGYYKASFNILVTEQSDITVGIRDLTGNDWVLFDDFKLVYQGNDASVYAETIQDLINEASTKGDDGILTTEADEAINNAIAAGEDAIAGGSSEDCLAAIAQLQEAISFAETTIELVASLDELYGVVNEIMMPTIESSDEELNTLLDEVLAKLEGDEAFETNEEVNNYVLSIKKAWTNFVQCDLVDGASEDEPADVTAVIWNPQGVDDAGDGSSDYWTATGTIGLGEGCTEMYNVSDSACVSQTIYGLAPGYYRLGVQGFYRGVSYISTIDAGATGQSDLTAKGTLLFADDTTTPLLRIADDAEAYNALDPNSDETLWNVPTSMATANTAFENELYKNVLQFEVAEGQESVTIGLQKVSAVSDDWLIWDNWTLEYLGTTEPTTDTTTAISEIETAGEPGTTEIYSVGGTKQSRLLKGVNVIKTTAADGTVKIQKVLVR